jgi:hypothetical protein
MRGIRKGRFGDERRNEVLAYFGAVQELLKLLRTVVQADD